MVEQRSPKPRVVSSSLTTPATSEQVSLVPIFYFIKNQSPVPLFLLFRKRSHSRRLFGCKRPHNAFGSLPTFCEESAYGANIFLRECLQYKYFYDLVLPLSEWTSLHSDFSYLKNRPYQVRADTQPPLRHQTLHAYAIRRGRYYLPEINIGIYGYIRQKLVSLPPWLGRRNMGFGQ